jgi:hypothetical protein
MLGKRPSAVAPGDEVGVVEFERAMANDKATAL